MTVREQRRSILHAGVEAMLDYLEQEYAGVYAELGVHAIVCEIAYTSDDGEEREGIPLWCSDARRFVQHGLLEVAARQVIE